MSEEIRFYKYAIGKGNNLKIKVDGVPGILRFKKGGEFGDNSDDPGIIRLGEMIINEDGPGNYLGSGQVGATDFQDLLNFTPRDVRYVGAAERLLDVQVSR